MSTNGRCVSSEASILKKNVTFNFIDGANKYPLKANVVELHHTISSCG